MNQWLGRLIGWIPAILFLLGMAFVTIPHLYLQRFINVIFRASEEVKRRTETYWQLSWARRYLKYIFAYMGIEMPIYIDVSTPIYNPCILVVNHRTALDHMLVAKVLEHLDEDHALWVAKKEFFNAPFVGKSLARTGSAFVTRSGDAQDKECIRAMARIARADRASVVIYPEGTRFTGKRDPDSSYNYLKDPKRGGLEVLMEELPTYPIVFVCLDWKGLKGGKTIWDGDSLLGIHGSVTVWRHGLPDEEVEAAEIVLKKGWTRMDEAIAYEQAS